VKEGFEETSKANEWEEGPAKEEILPQKKIQKAS